MRVFLFWPGMGGNFPLGIPLLQAIARQNGHETIVFNSAPYHTSPRSTRGTLYKSGGGKDNKVDRKLYMEQRAAGSKAFVEAVREFKPDIIAMSAFSTNWLIGLAYIRELPPGERPFLIVGGVHPTLVPEEVISEPEVDAICIGEGEALFKEFLASASVNGLSARKFDGIQNLWYKAQNGEIIKNDLGRVTDIETLPLPDMDGCGANVMMFVGKEYRFLAVELSRGCPLSCAYCCNRSYQKVVFHDKPPKIRRMSIDSGIKRLAEIKKKYNTEIFRFVDENFMTAPLAWLEEFCEKYSSEIGLPFTISASASAMTEDKIRLFKAAGCVNINMGPESGNEEYRKKVLNKAEPDMAYIKARRLCEDYEIRINANILFGLPLQTEEIIKDTIAFIRKLSCPISTEIFVPLPGSAMYDQLKAAGLYEGFKTDYDCYRSFGEPVYIPEGMTYERIMGLTRTMQLYAKLPETLWPLLKALESETEETNRLLDALELIFAV